MKKVLTICLILFVALLVVAYCQEQKTREKKPINKYVEKKLQEQVREREELGEALYSEMFILGSYAQAWYRTPIAMGGAGDATELPADALQQLGRYLDPAFNTKIPNGLELGEGRYTLSIDDLILNITGVSKKNSKITASIEVNLTESFE